jgi:hypothetical protein
MENIIDCLQKMNSSLRNRSTVVGSSTVPTSINRENVNTPSITQATVVILIFNQEQLGNTQENKDILNLSILQGKEKIFNFYSSSFDYQFH